MLNNIQPLISIIVPAYNLEKYIAKTLDSILAQTYKNTEIIIVDDGSTDSTPDIIDNYKNLYPSIKIITQKNSGVVAARKAGVNASNGDYIGFVDGDDLIDSDMYELLINNLLEKKADISHCGYVMHIGERKDYYYNTDKHIVQDNEQGLIDLVSGSFIEPGLVNKLFKREIIIKAINNPAVIGIKYLEDLLINYFAFKESNKSVYNDKCKYHYMVRNNSASTSTLNDNKITDPIKVFNTIMNDSTNESIKTKAYNRYISFIIGYSTADCSQSIKRKIKSLLKKEAKTVLKSHSVSKKTKLMFLLTTYFHNTYKLIRRLYERITHIDKKYKVGE